MAKWTRYFFRVKREDGTSDLLDGPAHGGLSIVKVQKGHYRLYHMKSGASLLSLEGAYVDIRRLAEAVVDLTDWEALHTTEAILAVPNIEAKIEGISKIFAEEVHRHVH